MEAGCVTLFSCNVLMPAQFTQLEAALTITLAGVLFLDLLCMVVHDKLIVLAFLFARTTITIVGRVGR